MIENWMEYCAKRGLVCQVNNSVKELEEEIRELKKSKELP
jgi:hypothetical protein